MKLSIFHNGLPKSLHNAETLYITSNMELNFHNTSLVSVIAQLPMN